jgi:radical SAM superfamily enzyme YgiQ (UPF0313 family)
VLELKVTLTTLNAKYIHSCLAVRCLQYACRDLATVDVQIKEYTVNHMLLDIVSDLYVDKPTVIGLACYIWNYDMTKQLIALLKKVLPDVVIILGGPEVSYDVAAVFDDCPQCDYVIVGEGEQVFHDLIGLLHKNARVPTLNGLARRGDVSTPAAFIPELDSLPFPYETEAMAALADKIIYYESSRGCPFSCQYCLSSVSKGVRYRSLPKVLQELNFFVSHQVRQVKFVDRTFNANKKHYLPILQYIKDLDTKTNFHFEIAVELLDDEVVDFLADMPRGRIQFEIGIQSTHEPTLAAIERHNRWDEIVQKVTRLRSYDNMHLHLDLIVGLPFESREIFRKSFNDVYALQPQMLQIGFLKMLKGAGLRSVASHYDYVWMDQSPYEVLQNNVLPYSDIRQLKIIEDVFEQLYNKGRFRATLQRLVELSADAFTFYEHFARGWERNNLHKVAHSSKNLYKHLFDYVKLYYPGEAVVMGQLLKYDALSNDGGKIRPDFLPWNGKLYDREIAAFWHGGQAAGYVPDFAFQTWREIQKKFHIEIFNVVVPRYLEGAGVLVQPTVLFFDYRGDEPRCQVIQSCDFWQKEGN